jgi:hypothetical protein
LAQLLGIEPRGQGGRADQIDEHHRELPPLGLRRGSCQGRARRGAGLRLCAPGRWGLAASTQGGDGVEQLAPVADDGDAHVLEVVAREPGQDLGVDLVVAEHRLVPIEPQAA